MAKKTELAEVTICIISDENSLVGTVKYISPQKYYLLIFKPFNVFQKVTYLGLRLNSR